jgi:DNA-binding NtrC family response regulator
VSVLLPVAGAAGIARSTSRRHRPWRRFWSWTTTVGIRELLSEILADEGHQVLLAESAGEARRPARTPAADLVLLDIWMPDTDGISLPQRMGSDGQLGMPVVMMSRSWHH